MSLFAEMSSLSCVLWKCSSCKACRPLAWPCAVRHCYSIQYDYSPIWAEDVCMVPYPNFAFSTVMKKLFYVRKGKDWVPPVSNMHSWVVLSALTPVLSSLFCLPVSLFLQAFFRSLRVEHIRSLFFSFHSCCCSTLSSVVAAISIHISLHWSHRFLNTFGRWHTDFWCCLLGCVVPDVFWYAHFGDNFSL